MKYFIPQVTFIGRNDDTEKLYAAEDAVREAVKEAADELGDVLGINRQDYWTRTMPIALMQLLDTFEKAVSEAAAIGLLESRGYTVMVRATESLDLPPKHPSGHHEFVRDE
jgi:hypothetical protein